MLKIETDAAASHHPDTRLRDIAEIVVGVIGEIVDACPELIVGASPLHLEVEHSIRLIVDEVAGGLGIYIFEISA